MAIFVYIATLYTVLFLFVVNAQMYDGLEAPYSDIAYGEQNGANDDDQYEGYDDKFMTYDENTTYDNSADYEYDYDYEVDELAKISFSMEKFTEFYTCLCLGTSQECNIHYSHQEDTISVYLVQKSGSFQKENNECLYYKCAHVSGTQTISCSQFEEGCNSGSVVQLFRLKSVGCCGSACVGLFWSSIEEQINFFQNSSDIESCSNTCLCPTEGKDSVNITKVVISSLLNDTHIDTYIIHKSDNASTKTSFKTTTVPFLDGSFASVSLKISRPPTITSVEFGDGKTHRLNTTNTEDNENKKSTLIIGATVGAFAFVSVLVCTLTIIFIMCRRKRRRNLEITSDKNKTPEAGLSPIFKPDPLLKSVGHITVSESSPKYYSKPAKVDSSTTNEKAYNQSQQATAISKNGGASSYSLPSDSNAKLEKRTNSAGSESNHMACENGKSSRKAVKNKEGFKANRENVEDDLEADYKESDRLTRGMLGEGKDGKFSLNGDRKKLSNAKVKEKEDFKEPLLTWPPVTESVV